MRWLACLLIFVMEMVGATPPIIDLVKVQIINGLKMYIDFIYSACLPIYHRYTQVVYGLSPNFGSKLREINLSLIFRSDFGSKLREINPVPLPKTMALVLPVLPYVERHRASPVALLLVWLNPNKQHHKMTNVVLLPKSRCHR